jgi:hypothetical protein
LKTASCLSLGEIQSPPCSGAMGPSDGSLQPTEPDDPHFDALMLHEVALGLNSKACVGKVAKGSLNGCAIGARDRARLPRRNSFGSLWKVAHDNTNFLA